MTTLTGGGAHGVLALGARAAVSHLGVLHLGGQHAAVAVSVPAGAHGVEITDVSLRGGGEHAAGYAMQIDGGEVLVRASTIEGGVGNDGTATIVNSQLAVSGAAGYGAYRCVGSYDGDYLPLDRNCAW